MYTHTLTGQEQSLMELIKALGTPVVHIYYQKTANIHVNIRHIFPYHRHPTAEQEKELGLTYGSHMTVVEYESHISDIGAENHVVHAERLP